MARDSANGHGTEAKRRMLETDIDPSGDATSGSGQTEEANTGRQSDNQPPESRENPAKSTDSEASRG